MGYKINKADVSNPGNINMSNMGRPHKLTDADKETFEKLCQLQCTEAEICGFFNCSDDTLNRWCKRTYKATFEDTYKKKHVAGLISLRRSQFRLAEINAAMAIFLGKNYLGQTDKFEQDNDDAIRKLDEIIAELKSGAFAAANGGDKGEEDKDEEDEDNGSDSD